jgi:hypothetical protein
LQASCTLDYSKVVSSKSLKLLKEKTSPRKLAFQMSPEQFANAKSDSRHHGSSTKITRVALQSKKDSEVQL